MRRGFYLGATWLLGLIALAGCSGQEQTQAPIVEKTTTTHQALTQTFPFDFDHGNVMVEVIIAQGGPLLLQNVTGGDATILLHEIATSTASWYDAVAPYSRTAIAFYNHIPRRPASEATNRNMNIAILYANYRTLLFTNPMFRTQWRAMVASVGFDPDDNSTDVTTPVGIGNVAGAGVVAARKYDGMNIVGDAGGKKYNLHPYQDTTGYEPVNSPFELSDPSRWQPKITTKNNGIFSSQTFVTPQYAVTDPFVIHHPKPYSVFNPPVRSDWRHNRAAYKAQADEVLAASADLNDERKMEAELFNNKVVALGWAAGFAGLSHGLGLEQYAQYEHITLAASFDAGITIWKGKRHFDAVRPESAIHMLYGNRKVRAWGGPGMGTVNDIRGKDWESYLPLPDHPEYPAGTACFCAAHAEASRQYFGSDALGLQEAFPAGSSTVEPGVTPASDVVLTYPTWSEWATRCGFSRLHGGVHFRSSIEESFRVCPAVGAKVYRMMMRRIAGDASYHAEDEDDD